MLQWVSRNCKTRNHLTGKSTGDTAGVRRDQAARRPPSDARVPQPPRCWGAPPARSAVSKGACMIRPTPPSPGTPEPQDGRRHHFRFHAPHAHLAPVFGSDWFGVKAEAFARFFGTPLFLGAQTLLVAVWIGLNMAGVTQFDLYPFILLNLAF